MRYLRLALDEPAFQRLVRAARRHIDALLLPHICPQAACLLFQRISQGTGRVYSAIGPLRAVKERGRHGPPSGVRLTEIE